MHVLIKPLIFYFLLLRNLDYSVADLIWIKTVPRVYSGAKPLGNTYPVN